MISAPHYGSFNARWLSFEEVARTFVPVQQFRQLGHEGHSVLLGPRGCGKTTLLKMLTRQALDLWERSERKERFLTTFPRPGYEAIYISSDVRWSYELANLPETANLSPRLSIQAQRIMVSVNALISILEATRGILGDRIKEEAAIAEVLIRKWRLINTLKSLADIRASLDMFVANIRGFLNVGDTEKLGQAFDSIPAMFYAHTLDAPINTIAAISEILPLDIRPSNWALCFDELEIAPAWLRKELLEALRSARQNIFLKLTWSPLLPSGLRTSPESASDFKPIRLWHSHVGDPRVFCEELAQDFLRERFPQLELTPDNFFRRSVLAAEGDEEPSESYERGSTEYTVFKDLASRDASFYKLLKEWHINPEDPAPASLQQKDQFFRKAKPIALLRLEFSTSVRERSRKRPAIYAGKEAVYAMSEGNPRWLRGLLNDFADLGGLDDRKPAAPLRINYKDQARLLNSAGQRFLSLIKASPFRPTSAVVQHHQEVTLFGFVRCVGEYFHNQIYSREFTLDPIGSFTVPIDADDMTIAVIDQLLELGGLVFIGSSPQDIPVYIRGSRFRLSFILSPIHRLALRTYREAPLEDVLRKYDGEPQMRLAF